MSARYIIGDTREVTATLPDGSIDFIMTSPPFLALRSYLPADHPAKHLEIGSEPDPATFLDVLLALTAEWGRVLAPHGSICVELGDTYSGSGGAGGDYNAGGLRNGQEAVHGSARRERNRPRDTRAGRTGTTTATTPRPEQGGGPGWPLAKSLCGIPHLYHLSLAYGRNLLTGEPSPAGQWRVRNVVAWCRPNPSPGALGDKFRPATSYLTIATKASDRYFDLDAVRGHPEDVKDRRTRTTNGPKQSADPAEVLTANYRHRVPSNPAGAPPLDYWVIPPAPYSGSHYAVYPPALCEQPIKSMVPRRVCTVCGEPSRRITEVTGLVDRDGRQVEREKWSSGIAEGKGAHTNRTTSGTTTTTTGWTDCGHNSWRNGRVLDPFAGTGTTLAVATGHGHDAIGIDLDRRNLALALDRVGPLLLAEATAPDLPGLLGTTEGAAA